MNYREALEFIGEVRAGLSWDRFCRGAVGLSDPLIDILNDSEKAREFLSLRGIRREYVSGHIRSILRRLHFNRDNDLYLTLALPHSASEARIHKRWKDLMLIYHPDRNPGRDAAECAMKINEAYNILKNPEKRSEYDAELRSLLARAKAREIRKYSSAALDKPSMLSPRMRRTLPKLIIPSCILIASIVLIAMFFENRSKRYVQHAPALQDAERTSPEKTGEKANAAGEDGMIRTQAGEGPEIARKAFPGDPNLTVKPAARPPFSPAGASALKGISRTVKEKESPEKAGTSPAEIPAGPAVTGKDWASQPGPVKEAPVERTADILVEPAGGLTAKAAQAPPGSAGRETEDVEKAVNLFISRYIRAYEEGDIGKFISLYSRSAIENNRMNYEEIRMAYQKNFERSRYLYSLGNVNFRRNGDTVVVTATYTIRKSEGNSPEVPIQGNIRWVLAKEGETLRIVKADYEGR